MNVLFLMDLASGDVRINHMNGDILIILVMTRSFVQGCADSINSAAPLLVAYLTVLDIMIVNTGVR